MSYPHVIISAVHRLGTETPESFWNDSSVRAALDGFDKEVHRGEWLMCEGEFRSNQAKDSFTLKTTYHSHRDCNVAEITLAGEDDMQDIQLTGIEDIIEEINFRFERDFTVEAYYWYDGVDRPGGTARRE